MENIKATRRNVTAAILANVDNIAPIFIDNGMELSEVRTTLENMAKSFVPKVRERTDSITYRQNKAMFEQRIRPYLAEVGMATARQIAENVEGLPVNADGKTTTQKVHGILTAALTDGVVVLVGDDDAKAFKKANKISDKACKVYQLA